MKMYFIFYEIMFVSLRLRLMMAKSMWHLLWTRSCVLSIYLILMSPTYETDTVIYNEKIEAQRGYVKV